MDRCVQNLNKKWVACWIGQFYLLLSIKIMIIEFYEFMSLNISIGQVLSHLDVLLCSELCPQDAEPVRSPASDAHILFHIPGNVAGSQAGAHAGLATLGGERVDTYHYQNIKKLYSS